MEPLPETREALRQLSSTGDHDLLAMMTQEATQVVAAVPGCLGLSITLRDHELTFTWLATDPRLRSLDAAQFLDDGPCERAATQGTESSVADLLEEERWRLLGLASAAIGVRSSLSLPLLGPDGPIGSINFYGTDGGTFRGRERHIARVFGSDVEAAVTNADLSMTSRQRAEHAVETLEALDAVDIASGILAEREGIPVDEALSRLRDAAERADAPLHEVSEIVIEWRDADL